MMQKLTHFFTRDIFERAKCKNINQPTPRRQARVFYPRGTGILKAIQGRNATWKRLFKDSKLFNIMSSYYLTEQQQRPLSISAPALSGQTFAYPGAGGTHVTVTTTDESSTLTSLFPRRSAQRRPLPLTRTWTTDGHLKTNLPSLLSEADLYRVTHHVCQNLLLTLMRKLRFSIRTLY